MAERMITKQQANAIRKATRAANRRIERATGGQKSYLEYYVTKLTGGPKFSAATKGLTYEEASRKIELLNKFFGAKQTTITGWKEAKKAAVQKANETLSEEGYDLTDEELAEILEQIDDGNNQAFYRAVNLVQVAKSKDSWEGTKSDIAEAIAQKYTSQEAFRMALEAREARK